VLGSLDRVADWLLADDTISQRSRDLLRRTGPATGVWEHAALDEVVPTESI
jgi:hypothetical protein